jgi:hypothetical protein
VPRANRGGKRIGKIQETTVRMRLFRGSRASMRAAANANANANASVK